MCQVLAGRWCARRGSGAWHGHGSGDAAAEGGDGQDGVPPAADDRAPTRSPSLWGPPASTASGPFRICGQEGGQREVAAFGAFCGIAGA